MRLQPRMTTPARPLAACVIYVGKPGKNLGQSLDGVEPAEGTDVEQCIAVVAAALLRTGWTQDTAVLAAPCLVVRAQPGVERRPSQVRTLLTLLGPRPGDAASKAPAWPL